MATLEVAADELVRKIQSVDGEINEAHDRFENLAEQVRGVGEKLDADWIELAKGAADLIAKAQEVRQQLGQDTAEAKAAVSGVDGAGDAAAGAFESVLQQATDAVAEFADAIREQEDPTEQLVADGVETPFEDLANGAKEVAEALDQALQQAQDFLADGVTESLRTLAADMREVVGEVKETLVEECGGALQDAFDDWAEKLAEVLKLAEQDGFKAAEEHAREVEEWALAKCAEAYDAELDELSDVIEVADEAVRSLQEELGECQTDVAEEGQEALGAAQTETQQALETMIEALDGVKNLLARYSFVRV